MHPCVHLLMCVLMCVRMCVLMSSRIVSSSVMKVVVVSTAEIGGWTGTATCVLCQTDMRQVTRRIIHTSALTHYPHVTFDADYADYAAD